MTISPSSLKGRSANGWFGPLAEGKGQDIGRAVLAAIVSVQFLDLLVADQAQADTVVGHSAEPQEHGCAPAETSSVDQGGGAGVVDGEIYSHGVCAV